ncbi:hypothetical protein ACFWF3_20955 [Nocardia sp. NPDC060220]|uniref:hypothetical protein n=1 Tax=Nocardia sp. NPDC060220 TaxID=3347076 RepID=UPI00365CB495
MRTNGLSAWTEDFHEVPWSEIARFYRGLSERHPNMQHLTDIVDSVMRSGRDRDMAATMSMHDLIVTARPVSEAPIEEVVVRAPGSLVEAADGTVIVECLSDVNPGQIVGPVGEAVPLFWHCVATVFSIMPPSKG